MYRNIECESTPSKKFTPQRHQIKAVDDALRSEHKGMLMYHTLGSGKSCTSIMFADAILKRVQNKSVTIRVFLPAALRTNFIDEYCKLCGKNPKFLRDRYVFYSYNYSKILKLLPLNFDDSIIIVDEAHKLINGKRNGSHIASVLYKMMYEAKNAKILLLTGTPLQSIVDVALYIALLKPSEDSERIANHIGSYTGEDFQANLDLRPTTMTVNGRPASILVPRNVDRLKNDLKGIVSYYSGEGASLGRDSPYPQKIDMPIQKVQMTKYQTGKFFGAVEWELMHRFKPDEKLKYENPPMYILMMGLWQVAYKNFMTRAASNFAYPKSVDVPIEGTIKTFEFNIVFDLANIDLQEIIKMLAKRSKKTR